MNDKRIKEILKGITVIVDTREHEEGNPHIIRYFENNGIPYVKKKLDFADYSFYAPPIPELKIAEPMSFENRYVIERKANLEELSGNLSNARERFVREFERCIEKRARMTLMVEDGNWQSIFEHKYKTNLNEKSFMASLFTYQHRYNLKIEFVPEKYAGMFIYSQFYYMLRDELKQFEVVA